MNYYSFDLLDRTLDEVQIFTGFEDSNLEIIEKHFKTKLLIRSHEIKIEENENTESIVFVIQKCASPEGRRLSFTHLYRRRRICLRRTILCLKVSAKG